MFRLIDSHSHLEEISDLERALDEAREAGVIGVIAVGMDKDSNERVLSLGETYPGLVFPALGLHPWCLDENFREVLEFVREHVEECVALGEVGMDFKIPKPKRLQLEAFEEVVSLASRFKKPLIVHSRWAWMETLESLKGENIPPSVFHWYTGPLEILQEVLEEGHYISATPAAEYSAPHISAIKECPLDRVLLETDSPVKYRGVESRPKDVLRSLKAVSKIKNLDEKEVAERTTENAIKVFGLEL